MKLATDLHLVSRLKMHRPIPLSNTCFYGMHRGKFLLFIYELISEASNRKFVVGDERCYVVMAHLKGATPTFVWRSRIVIENITTHFPWPML